MAVFHVFVERPTDNTPDGIKRLAEAIGKHYGLPSQGLFERLQKGRFRVKGNADKETADLYVRDLELLGAVCTLEESTPENAQKITPMPFPAVRPATPVAGVPTTRQSQPSILPPPSRPSTPPPTGGLTSGLSAAFSGEQPAADLGALGGGDIPLSLASVDGSDEQGGGDAASFEPPGAALPASIGPAPDKKKAEKPDKKARPKDEPLDLFAPPDQQGEEFQVKIAADEEEVSARKRASTPPPVGDGEPPSRKSQPSMQPPNRKSQPSLATPAGGSAVVGGTAAPSKLGPLANERVRFVAGIVLAILLGFIPAHLIASSREKDAYADIDAKLMHTQQQADTTETYAMLDKQRADYLDRKESERRNIAILAFVIWGAIGGAFAFAWFKKIPWDSLE